MLSRSTREQDKPEATASHRLPSPHTQTLFNNLSDAEPGADAKSFLAKDDVLQLLEQKLDRLLEEQQARGTPLKQTILAILLGICIGAGLTYGTMLLPQEAEAAAIVLHPPPTPQPTSTATAQPTPAPLTVFVTGAVLNEGLYELPPDSRIGDAVDLAGGYLPEANHLQINQAEPLWDGAQIHVPAVMAADEFDTPDQANTDTNVLTINSSPGDSSLGSAIAQPAAGISGGGNSASASGSSSANPGLRGLIDLNTATLEELMTLPGIGASKAANIIAARPFATVDELEKVSGIGEKTVEKLRSFVAVQP